VITQTVPGDAIPARTGQRKSARVKSAWNTVVTWVRKEPAATQALIQVFIAIGIAFQWWHWSDAQTGAVVGITAALLGMFIRSQVTPLIQPATRGRRLIPAPDEAEVAPAPPVGQ
jgi:hypothetical protein